MKPFIYLRATAPAEALAHMTTHQGAKFLGGGTNLIDLMREQIEQPTALVDLTPLPLADVTELPDGRVRVGALVRNAQLAADPLIRQRYPVLAQAILNGASAQLRNMATLGGNLLQRTRCYYFYDQTARCNKRRPGSGCDALGGFNRIHAILGTSDACIATHPSDMSVALAALDATVVVLSPRGEREIPLTDLHFLPGDTPHIETVLEADELITSVLLPALPFATNSHYRKVRDRASYAFALVSVAAALAVEDNCVKQVHLALGGVAPKPWRARKAEQALLGQEATTQNFQRAAEAELAEARGFEHNGFKIPLAQRTITHVLQELARR